MTLPEETFTCFVLFVEGEGAFTAEPKVAPVSVLARTEGEATLVALEMVACHACPVGVEVDYSNH